MFPLKNRQLIRGCQAHITAGLGCGADHVANYVELYAPFSGDTISTFLGAQGGNWLRLKRPNGEVIEFAHLDRYIKKTGVTKEGEVLAITGNTGQVTTGPHLHTQIFRNGVRIDPEKYDWKPAIIEPMPTCEQQLAQERADHAESIKEKELNYKLWQEQLSRANGLEAQLKEKIAESQLNYDNWQKELDRANGYKGRLNEIKGLASV